MKHLGFALLVASFLVTTKVWSYPEFIGYGYASCLTCHYNSHGNGAINDYGRAVWATEVAGRLWAGKKSGEQLGETSGFFFGPAEKLWWIRPGIKARHLWAAPSPGSKAAKSQGQNVLMQADASVALFFKKDQSLAFVGSLGYVPQPLANQNSATAEKLKEQISREHYFRWQASKPLWLYFGMMDKVFGTRIVNHTAFSRRMTGLAMNDQSHGVTAHYIQSSWEATTNIFMGNMFQDAEFRQQGISGLAEFEMAEAFRLGFSVLSSKNKYLSNDMFAIHTRSGLSFGSSILFELGLINKNGEDGTVNKGYYMFSQFMQRFSRGYHFFLSAQAYKPDMVNGEPDQVKNSLGLIIWPRNRFELRTELENSLNVVSNDVTEEGWKWLTQFHISL